MDARTLTYAGLAGTLTAIAKGTSAVSETRKALQAMADAPMRGPRCPKCCGTGFASGFGSDFTCARCGGSGRADDTEEETDSDREFRARMDWQQEEFDANPPCGWDDETFDEDRFLDDSEQREFGETW